MKILVVGDFHGEFPSKFNKIINKEKMDLVVSLGDYPPFHYRKLWFKHCYGKDVELWEIIGKSKYKKLVMKDLKMAENALKKLNRVKVPVFTVLGNIDWPSFDDVADDKKNAKTMPNFDRKDKLAKIMKKYKNINRFDYKSLRFGDYFFIGMRGHSFPGKVKSKAFRRHKKILEKLFKKFRKENKDGKVIFVSHNIAYNTKLDRLSLKASKFALKSAGKKHTKILKIRKRHYGSKLARRIIDKYHPSLHLGGHIHESLGKDKLKRTIIINPGAVHEGKAAIVEINEGKIKKIKFLGRKR